MAGSCGRSPRDKTGPIGNGPLLGRDTPPLFPRMKYQVMEVKVARPAAGRPPQQPRRHFQQAVAKSDLTEGCPVVPSETPAPFSPNMAPMKTKTPAGGDCPLEYPTRFRPFVPLPPLGPCQISFNSRFLPWPAARAPRLLQEIAGAAMIQLFLPFPFLLHLGPRPS